MAVNDLTGQNIQDTYQRILQVSSSGEITDGTGSLYTPISASHAISASYAISSSHEIIKEISSSHANIADNLSLGANININHITASGNISSSGTIFADSVEPRQVIADELSGTIQTAAQTSITSVGTLSALSVSGEIVVEGNNTITAATGSFGRLDGGTF